MQGEKIAEVTKFNRKWRSNPNEKRAPEKQTPVDRKQINIVYTVEKPRDGPNRKYKQLTDFRIALCFPQREIRKE